MAKTMGPITRTLKAARKLIARKNGWTKGSYRKEQGQTVAYCAVGAIEKATGKGRKSDALFNVTEFVIRCLPKSSGRSLVGYNDNPRRKQEQVVALFDRAIKQAQAKGL